LAICHKLSDTKLARLSLYDLKCVSPSSPDDLIRILYGAIVAQARSAAFYAHYGVADSIEGRFELLVLHLVLALRRLGGELKPRPRSAASAAAIGQQLFDLFCRDLDDNLREMGVGDLAVPRRMRQFGEAFYGRHAAYLAALDAADPQELEKALARNILGQTETSENAARLARYTRSAVALLAAAADADLLAGKVEFPKPETLQNG
jgi:cytochrome b pre-mRNA-processing protein 3